MTGWGSIETAVEAMRRGARGFIHKPWDNDALADAIRREVDDGRATRNAERAPCASRRRRRPSSARCCRGDARVAGCDIAARWIPASAFGGDCYDVTPLDANASRSRSPTSAARACRRRCSWRTCRRRRAPSPPRLVAPRRRRRVNRELVRNAALRRFVTFFYAVYDRRRAAAFLNAGHNPPVLLRADGRSPAWRRRHGAGAFDDAVRAGRDDGRAWRSRLVLFTDGITEACTARARSSAMTAWSSAVIAARVPCDAAAIVDALFREVQATVVGPVPGRRHRGGAGDPLASGRTASVHKLAGRLGPVRESKAKPRSSSRPGTTRRLFRTSSVSVRRKNAPISSIHRVAGRPTRAPQASRSARMNSALGSGFGAARLTGAVEVVVLDQPADRADEVLVVDPRDVLPAVAARAAEAAAHQAEQHVEDAAAVRAHHHRRAQQRPCACAASRGLARARSHAVATSMLKRQVSGHAGLGAAEMPVASSFAAS